MFGDRKPFPLFPNETYDHFDGRVSPNECPGRAHFFFRSAGQFVRAGTPVKPEDYESIRLYCAPKDIHKTRERFKSLGYGVSELEHRDYGQTEFFLTDDDGYWHCFGVPTQR